MSNWMSVVGYPGGYGACSLRGASRRLFYAHKWMYECVCSVCVCVCVCYLQCSFVCVFSSACVHSCVSVWDLLQGHFVPLSTMVHEYSWMLDVKASCLKTMNTWCKSSVVWRGCMWCECDSGVISLCICSYSVWFAPSQMQCPRI